MSTTNGIMRKAAAIAAAPALMMGMSAVPAFAYTPAANTTNVTISNSNSATVNTSVLGVIANTGGNVSIGGAGGNGGASGNSGSSAGDGGAGGSGGDGGYASADSGDALGGNGGYASDGGYGGSTGSTGVGGNGGNGGNGGSITTGEAVAAVVVTNEVNHSLTDLEVEESDAAHYNEYYEAAAAYYEEHESEAAHSQESDNGFFSDSWSESDWEAESHAEGAETWEQYKKLYVPNNTNITVSDDNTADVTTEVALVAANTGLNMSAGADGGTGGTSGTSGSDAGNGGAGGNAGDGGAASSYDDDPWYAYTESEGLAAGGDAGDGAFGGDGGSTGSTGDAGHGGNGGNGGSIVTRDASTIADVRNSVNISNYSIKRFAN